MSRPQAEINWDIVAEYLEAGCSGAEIASMIGISDSTLYDRCQIDKGILFSEYSRQNREKGDLLLKKVQFESAIKDKDRTMLIWLGKQRLGQKEKAEQDIKVDGGINIIFKPANETSSS